MKKKIITLIAILVLAAVLGGVMVACSGIPSSLTAEQAKEKLEAAGYEVDVMEITDANKSYAPDGALSMLEGGKEENEKVTGYISMMFFDDASKAKAYYESDEFKKGKERFEEEVKEDNLEIEIGISGKCIYMGTKDALKLLK